jgi:hypothetical protein
VIDKRQHSSIIDASSVDKRQHSNIIDTSSFRGAKCDVNMYLLMAEVRERMQVRRWPM